MCAAQATSWSARSCTYLLTYLLTYLGDELEREELYEEYALSLERKEQSERRAKRKEAMGTFRGALAAAGVGVRSQWRRIQSQLESDPAFRGLEKIDRLAVFEEYSE